MWQTLLLVALVMVGGWIATRATEKVLLLGGLRDNDETERVRFHRRE